MDMKNITFAAILLVVAAFGYGLGRWQGTPRGTQGTAEQPNSVVSAKQDSGAPIPGKSDNKDRVESARGLERIDPAAPFARNMTAAQRGYEAAQIDLEAALKQIESLAVSE